MATKLSEIISDIRINLQERTPRFWKDAELLAHVNAGIKDLARSLNTQYQNFFFETNTNVRYVANAETLVDVPNSVSTVLGLELADANAYPNIEFVYKDFNDRLFRNARAMSPIDPTTAGQIFFCFTGAGAPVAAPKVYIAPRLDTALTLRMTFIPTLGRLTVDSNNPVPGESDHALVCWGTAHARAKIREEQTPDPEWLALYATEKTNILVAVTPRQEVTDQVAESPFGDS